MFHGIGFVFSIFPKGNVLTAVSIKLLDESRVVAPVLSEPSYDKTPVTCANQALNSHKGKRVVVISAKRRNRLTLSVKFASTEGPNSMWLALILASNHDAIITHNAHLHAEGIDKITCHIYGVGHDLVAACVKLPHRFRSNFFVFFVASGSHQDATITQRNDVPHRTKVHIGRVGVKRDVRSTVFRSIRRARDQACKTSQGEASDRYEGRHAARNRTSGVRGNRYQVASHAGEINPQSGTPLPAPTRVPI